jgi:hypothetical protein
MCKRKECLAWGPGRSWINGHAVEDRLVKIEECGGAEARGAERGANSKGFF